MEVHTGDGRHGKREHKPHLGYDDPDLAHHDGSVNAFTEIASDSDSGDSNKFSLNVTATDAVTHPSRVTC